MQPETRFKENFRKKLDQIPGSWWVKIAQRSLRGIPDILGCINGKFIAIELKAKKKNADPLQTRTLHNIKLAEGISLIAYPENADDVIAFLRGL